MRKYICKHCGAHLDPGEHCDCVEKQAIANQVWISLVKQRNDGQFTMSDNPDQSKED